MTVQETHVSATDCSHYLKNVTFCDRYETPLNHPEASLQDIYWNVFSSGPKWVNDLMNLRNRITRHLGLKSSSAKDLNKIKLEAPKHKLTPPDKIGLFRVFSHDDDELIVGENDSHLDFRISVTKRNGKMQMTTAVSTNNAMGRAYMFFIKPFHKLIAKTMIQAAYKSGKI